jgi:hypothetical protein
MSLFDFLGLGGLFGSGQPQAQPGLMAAAQPPAAVDPFTGMTPSQQKWQDAIMGMSAALKDAGAYLQHQPEAANNVAAFNQERQTRTQNNATYAGLQQALLGAAAPPGQMFANPPNPATRSFMGAPAPGLSGFGDYSGGALPADRAAQLAPFLNALPPSAGIPFAADLLKNQLLPQAPIKVGQGESLIDPTTLKPVFSAAPEADFQEKNYGVNPTTGKLDTYVIDRRTGKTQWLNIPPKPDIAVENGTVIDKNTVQPGTVIPPALLTPEQIQQRVQLAAQTAGAEEAARQGNINNRYGEAKVVEADDGQGGKTQVLAQQDKTTGQWVTGDQTRTPLTGVNLMPTTGNSRIAGQIIRITTGAHDIASELENIVKLGTGASAGFLPKAGAMGTPLGALARGVTSQEVQSYKTAGVGLSRALASLEAAGLAPPGGLTSQMEGLQLAQGDTQLTKLQKIGSIAQQSQNAMDAILASPLLSDKQRAEVQGLKARIQAAVPWTPANVIDLVNSGNPGMSLGALAQSRGLAPKAPMTLPGGITVTPR